MQVTAQLHPHPFLERTNHSSSKHPSIAIQRFQAAECPWNKTSSYIGRSHGSCTSSPGRWFHCPRKNAGELRYVAAQWTVDKWHKNVNSKTCVLYNRYCNTYSSYSYYFSQELKYKNVKPQARQAIPIAKSCKIQSKPCGTNPSPAKWCWGSGCRSGMVSASIQIWLESLVYDSQNISKSLPERGRKHVLDEDVLMQAVLSSSIHCSLHRI